MGGCSLFAYNITYYIFFCNTHSLVLQKSFFYLTCILIIKKHNLKIVMFNSIKDGMDLMIFSIMLFITYQYIVLYMYSPFVLTKVKNDVNWFCGIVFRGETFDMTSSGHIRFWSVKE